MYVGLEDRKCILRVRPREYYLFLFFNMFLCVLY